MTMQHYLYQKLLAPTKCVEFCVVLTVVATADDFTSLGDGRFLLQRQFERSGIRCGPWRFLLD
jgi:hypothetical protein